MKKLKYYITGAVITAWTVFFGSLGIFGFSFIPVRFAPFTQQLVEEMTRDGFSPETITFIIALHTTLIVFPIIFVVARFVLWSFKKPSSLHAQGISFLFISSVPLLIMLLLFRSFLHPSFLLSIKDIIAYSSALLGLCIVFISLFPLIAEHYRRAMIAEEHGGILPETEKKNIDTKDTTHMDDLRATYALLFTKENKTIMRYCIIGMLSVIIPIILTFFFII